MNQTAAYIFNHADAGEEEYIEMGKKLEESVVDVGKHFLILKDGE